jgi:hypothetical protein
MAEALGVLLCVLEEKHERVRDDCAARSAALGRKRAPEALPLCADALDQLDGAGVALKGVLARVSHV